MAPKRGCPKVDKYNWHPPGLAPCLPTVGFLHTPLPMFTTKCSELDIVHNLPQQMSSVDSKAGATYTTSSKMHRLWRFRLRIPGTRALLPLLYEGQASKAAGSWQRQTGLTSSKYWLHTKPGMCQLSTIAAGGLREYVKYHNQCQYPDQSRSVVFSGLRSEDSAPVPSRSQRWGLYIVQTPFMLRGTVGLGTP